MKAFCFLLLALLPLMFAQEYIVPDFGVDTREATCKNVKKLTARAQEDLSRLQNYYQVTLPERIMKANNVILSIKKTCKIITRSKPSLVQVSNSKMGNKALLTLQSLSQQYKDLATSIFNDNQVNLVAPDHLKKSLLLETSQVEPWNLCQDVYNSVTALIEYLYWLSGIVDEQYISSFLPERLGQLSSVYSHCFPDTDVPPPTTTTPTDTTTSLFSDGSQITLRCLGSDYNDAYQYLDSYTYTGGTGLAPNSGGPYTGTHWQVHVNSDGSVSLESLGDFKNPNFVWLDGRTGDGSVGLAPYNYEPYSGTHWQVEQLADGSYTFKCLGSDYNADHLYLDGRTGDGSIGLAPYTWGGYSGTHWDVQYYKPDYY